MREMGPYVKESAKIKLGLPKIKLETLEIQWFCPLFTQKWPKFSDFGLIFRDLGLNLVIFSDFEAFT